jgi:hypothetical protein
LDGENFIQQQFRQNVKEQHAQDDDEFDEVANQADAIAEGRLPMQVDEAGPSERVNILPWHVFYRFNLSNLLAIAKKTSQYFRTPILQISLCTSCQGQKRIPLAVVRTKTS